MLCKGLWNGLTDNVGNLLFKQQALFKQPPDAA